MKIIKLKRSFYVRTIAHHNPNDFRGKILLFHIPFLPSCEIPYNIKFLPILCEILSKDLNIFSVRLIRGCITFDWDENFKFDDKEIYFYVEMKTYKIIIHSQTNEIRIVDFVPINVVDIKDIL